VALAPWAAAVVGVLVGGVAAWTAVRGVRRDPALLALGGLVGWAVILAALRPVDPGPAAWTVAGGMAAWVTAAAAQRPRAQRGALWGVALAGVAAAVHLAVERLVEGGRPGGPLEQPVLAATVAVLALAVLPALRLPTAAAAVAGAVLLAGIAASGSRAGMLAVVALAAVWALRLPTAAAAVAGAVLLAGIAASGSRAGMLAVVALAAVWTRRWGAPTVRRAAAGVAVIGLIGLSIRVATDPDPLRWERVRIWQVAARTALAEAPWGAGPGGFADAALPHNFPRVGELARWYREPSLAESDVLQLAAVLGIPGLGLGATLALLLLARATPVGLGVLAALAVTSAVNTQLPVPAVAVAAALAVAGTQRRPRRVCLWRCTRPQAVAVGALVAVVTGLALSWPRPGLLPDAETLAAEVRRLAPRDPRAALVQACEVVRRRPRWGEGRRLWASLYLAQGVKRREAALVERAAQEYAAARAANPTDAFAAYGEAECARLLGEPQRAHRLAQEAVRLEPHFARAWVLLAALELAQGQLDGACQALERAEKARRAGDGVVMISAYEVELVRWDPARATLVASACGGSR